MVSERPQRADDIFNFILLKQADAGNASRSSVQARCGIFDGDATERKERNFSAAGIMQGGEARGLRSGRTALAEYRSEHGEVCSLGIGALHVLVGMAGGGYEEVGI